jgi:hypothetical protein
MSSLSRRTRTTTTTATPADRSSTCCRSASHSSASSTPSRRRTCASSATADDTRDTRNNRGSPSWSATRYQTRGPAVPWGLRAAVAALAVGVLVALVAWFAVDLVTGSSQTGLAERVMGAAQALWPLAVVFSCFRLGPSAGTVPPARSAPRRHAAR